MDEFIEIVSEFLIHDTCRMPGCQYVAAWHIDLICWVCQGTSYILICNKHLEVIEAGTRFLISVGHAENCNNENHVWPVWTESLLDTNE